MIMMKLLQKSMNLSAKSIKMTLQATLKNTIDFKAFFQQKIA